MIDTLTDPEDTRECAEAVARDWAGQAVEPNVALIAIATPMVLAQRVTLRRPHLVKAATDTLGRGTRLCACG